MLPDTPLILLCGTCCNGWFFWPQAAEFVRRSDGSARHVIVPDWLSHADPNDGTALLPRLGARLASAWHRGGFDGALVVGHSMGAVLGVLACASGRFRASGLLILDGAIPVLEDRKEFLRDMGQKMRDCADPDPAKQRQRLKPLVHSYVFDHLAGPHDDRAVLEKAVERMSSADPSKNGLLLQSAAVVDLRAALRQVPGRVAALAADPPRMPVDEFRRIRPDADVMRVNGSGHFLPLFAPQAVNTAIRCMMESKSLTGTGLVPAGIAG